MKKITVAAASILVFLVFVASAATAMAAPSGPPVAFDGDVVALAGSANGHSIASLSGSIGRRGRGSATLAPSGYARRAGYGRGEQALIIRRADGTFLVLGGLGTRLTISVSGDSFAATGSVATRMRGRQSMPARGFGLVVGRRARPQRGQLLLVHGSPRGPVVDALRKRYHLVQYDARLHSRDALLANPVLYAEIAGMVVDKSLRASDADAVSEVRAMFNSGRWVAASPRSATLSTIMYPLFHAHFRGTQGALIRSANVGNGTAARKRMVVLEPRLHWFRTAFGQRRLKRQLPPVRTMASMRRQARRGLLHSLVAGEYLEAKAPKRAHTRTRQTRQGEPSTGTGDYGCNSTTLSPQSANSPTAPGVALYEICVNSTVIVATTAGTLLNPWGNIGSNNLCGSFLGASSWCATGLSTCATSGGGWPSGQQGWDCGANYGTMYSPQQQPNGPNQWITLVADGYPATLSMVSTMQFERSYVVSLGSTGSGAFQQWLTEIDGSNFSAIDTADNAPLTTLGSSNGQTSLTPQPSMFPTGSYCGLGSGNSCQFGTTNQLVSANPWQSPYWWEPSEPSEPSGSGVMIEEGGFSGGAFLHLTSMSYQPQQGQTAQPVIASSNGANGGTSPLQADVTANVSGSSSDSSETWGSQQVVAGWSVGASLDASCETADCEATGEASGSISAGYSHTTTTNEGSESATSMTATSSQTLANWSTQAFIASAAGASATGCGTPASSVAGATTVQGPCSAWLLDSVWYPNANWGDYVPALEFGAQPSQGSIFATQCASNGTGCFDNTAASYTGGGWGAGQNLNSLNPASVASFVLQESDSGSGSTGFVGTVTPNDEDTFYLVDQVSTGPLGSGQAQVLGVMMSQLGATVSGTCMGACTSGFTVTPPSSGVQTVVSTFTMGGTPVAGGGNQTTLSDLDLCAPPVVTAQLWQDGCSEDPAYTEVPPQTWAPIPLMQSGIELSAPYQAKINTPVTCEQGTWSNATTYSYAWYQYVTAQNQNAWEPVASGVSKSTPNTFTPPSGSTGKSFLCAVTAKGPQGSSTVTSGALTVING